MTPTDDKPNGSSGREHSRAGSGGGHSVRSGARELHADDERARAARDAAPESGGADGQRQPFVPGGQFTGRPIPAQDGSGAQAPTPQEAAQAYAQHGGLNVAPGQPVMQQVDPSTQEGWVQRSDYDALHQKLTETTAQMQRIAADFDNFRKRAAREREQVAAAADAKLLGELLQVLDDFERALEHAGEPEGSGADASQLADGIRMVHGRLLSTLAGHGLEEVPTDGEFDPHLHEAMMLQPTEGVEENHVVGVLQKGYRLGDRVLRHAKVIVAGGE